MTGAVMENPPRFGEAQMGRGTAGRSPVVEGFLASQFPSVSRLPATAASPFAPAAKTGRIVK